MQLSPIIKNDIVFRRDGCFFYCEYDHLEDAIACWKLPVIITDSVVKKPDDLDVPNGQLLVKVMGMFPFKPDGTLMFKPTVVFMRAI